jgi:hypothetical protein
MTEQVPLPPHKIAFVIDNNVVDILHTDARLAAIFLSEPLILDVTDKFTEGEVPGIFSGDIYDPETGDFNRPQPTE